MEGMAVNKILVNCAHNKVLVNCEKNRVLVNCIGCLGCDSKDVPRFLRLTMTFAGLPVDVPAGACDTPAGGVILDRQGAKSCNWQGIKPIQAPDWIGWGIWLNFNQSGMLFQNYEIGEDGFYRDVGFYAAAPVAMPNPPCGFADTFLSVTFQTGFVIWNIGGGINQYLFPADAPMPTATAILEAA